MFSDTMANIIFAEQENTLQPPNLKMRQRLLSAPGVEISIFPLDVLHTAVTLMVHFDVLICSPPEKLLKTPTVAKTFNTPLQSGRKAFGAVNKIPTPAVSRQEHKLLKPQVRERYIDVFKKTKNMQANFI